MTHPFNSCLFLTDQYRAVRFHNPNTQKSLSLKFKPPHSKLSAWVKFQSAEEVGARSFPSVLLVRRLLARRIRKIPWKCSECVNIESDIRIYTIKQQHKTNGKRTLEQVLNWLDIKINHRKTYQTLHRLINCQLLPAVTDRQVCNQAPVFLKIKLVILIWTGKKKNHW